MEPIVYKSILYIPIAIIGGFDAQDVAIVHFFTLIIGHLNHANLGWDYGVFKYIFNNPKMHIWHHAKQLPDHVRYGVNYGLTLSLWDYLFKTDYVPHAWERRYEAKIKQTNITHHDIILLETRFVANNVSSEHNPTWSLCFVIKSLVETACAIPLTFH